MDAKDLRTEAALGARSNDGNSKQTQASVLQANRNKTYHDIGSNSANKVEAQAARPCAVIGPDRVVPPPAPVDAYLKKASIEPWPGPDSTYRRPPEYPHKLTDYNHPSRNISPRQTFQENMQRFMLPPSYNNTTKLKDDHNFPVDMNISPQRNKLSGSTEAKYCEVPYVVSPLASEQKNIKSADISVSSNNAAVPKTVHGWFPSSNIRPTKPYSAEVYPYPEYQSCAGPRPMLMPRPHRTVHEESGHVYNEAYYHDASLRYKPYPAAKERFPQGRYEYVGNYSNPFHPPPPFPSHKYDVQKQVPPYPYSGYPQVPLKYMDTRMTDPTMNSYQRPINPHTNFNPVAYCNQIIHPQYGPVQGNSLQTNKFYPYPPDKSIAANKSLYDPTTRKSFGEYENMRAKPYPMSETYYVNEMMRHHPIKAPQIMPPNYPTVGMHGIPPHPYYRKENPTMMNYETNPNCRNIDPSINLNASMLSRLPTQFSPNAIAISPSESNTSNDTTHTLGTSQEDCGYVSQSSSASMRSVDSGLNRMQSDFYRSYDYRYSSMVKPIPSSKSNVNSDSSLESKNKKNIDLRQYLQMWNEGEDENGDREITVSSNCNTHEVLNHSGNTNQEQLYVLGLVNVPSEELSKYEHIQKISKLPENIKGYNSIELLNQFEEVIESSNLNNYSSKPPTPKSFQISSLKSSSMQSIGIPSRPLSPLDVEAKISQSIIHKEVGCNFEIKPCSPKMLNVEIATPIQNVLSERVIEKVTNHVLVPTSILTRVNDKVSDCEIKKHQDHRIPLNDNKASSCKMVSSQYTSSENLDSAKSNYSLQDLESNSGVCLASLPRLDNDIELTFPEVNQQFINANKVESVITQNNSQKDLPTIDAEQSEDLQEIELKNLSPEGEHEKEFSKLSKYRKRRRMSDSKEDNELNIQSIRTNSVIIKNPENTKYLEKVSNNNTVNNNNAQNVQQDPINLTMYNDPQGNPRNSCGNENTTDTSQDFTEIDYIKNSSIEIDKKACFVGNNQNLRKEECGSEENIIEKSMEFQKPNIPKSKEMINYALEISVINENKIDTKLESTEEFSSVEKFRKANFDKSDSNKVSDCENNLNNKQNIIKEVSYQKDSSLDNSKINSENSVCPQLIECDPNVNPNSTKPISTQVTDEHKQPPKNYEEKHADQQLSVNNLNFSDNDEIIKIGEEDRKLISLEMTSDNDQSFGIKSHEECKQQSDMITEKNFDSILGRTQNRICVNLTKVHKELYSPRMQNLILCIEGNSENSLKNTSHQQESAENEFKKACMHISLKECEVESHGNFESSLKVTEISQVECLDDKNKTKSVYWDALPNSDKDMSATTEQQTLKTDKVSNDDSSEIISTSSTTNSNLCDNESDLTSNFEEDGNISSSPISKDISKDFNPTELVAMGSEISKENVTAGLETGRIAPVQIPCTNDEYKNLSNESSEKTNYGSSIDEGLEFKTPCGTAILEEPKNISNCDIKANNSLTKDKLQEKKFAVIQIDDCSPMNMFENEGNQECKHNMLNDSKISLQCKSLEHLDQIGGNTYCIPENSNFIGEGTNNTDSTAFKENQICISNKWDHKDRLKLMENEKNKDDDSIDSSFENIEQIGNGHDSSSNNITNLEDLDTDSSSSKNNIVCNDFVPEEKVNSNESFHDASETSQSIDHIKKSCEETVEILHELYPDVPKTDELTFNELSSGNSTKLKFPNANNTCLNKKGLKRSLSDSAINVYNQEDQDNTYYLNKRKKTLQETLQPHIITENYCSIFQNNRRNSISSIYNEDNVSFCILLDSNCILTEDSQGSDKYCYTELPEHCLSSIESDGDNEIMEECTELISIQGEINYNNCENLVLHEDSNVVDEQDLQETWVEDIACVETVVSDEVAEDIVPGSMSPKDTDISDDDNDIFNTNEHSDKVKYIYGDKMCTNDAHLVETLYRTPQMNVNKTLVNRESQGIDDCHRYYDEVSLEKLLSESTNFQTETGCSLSALSPPSPSIPNTHTDLSKKPDLGFNKDLSFSCLNSTELTKAESLEHNNLQTQDDTVHSCETRVDDDFSFDQVEKSPKRTTSSSPEVSSTTSEERNSGILLKITKFGGARVAQVNSLDVDKNVTNVSCKYTENKDYAKSHNNLVPNRPLITKAAQKYIPPLKETIRDLKIKLPLPQHSLLKLRELKMSKEVPKPSNKINKHTSSNSIRKEIPKKSKPKFEDVLKSIDEIEYKMHKEKSKKSKRIIPKVVIKKNENGSHYTSTSNKDKYNPDLTGRKWQPWVFIEKNNFIDKMALKKKTKAIFSHRKNTFILAETFKKYKSITNAKFVISHPTSESSTGQLKYTIRLKHNY